MKVVITLARDTLANVRRFVEGNLSHGADHVLVLLDQPEPEVEAFLTGHPHASHAVLDDRFWKGERAEGLNDRQRVAANLGRVALLLWGGVDWYFFVDGDEVVLLDHDVLDSIGPQWVACRLTPLESLCGGEPDEFKRQLRRPGLQRLVERGVIEKPRNEHLFRGHVIGKFGVRPHWEVRSGIHRPRDLAGEKVSAYEHPSLQLLHLESPTYEEFVRKMTHLTSQQDTPVMRPGRRAVVDHFRAATANPDGSRREESLRALYDREVLDDVEALRRAGAVVRMDVVNGPHTPIQLEFDRRKELQGILDRLITLDPGLFRAWTDVDELRNAALSVVGQA